MIYRDGNKISAVYHNGKPISKIFRDGKLVWQKNTLVGKRVKSITVRLPAWGTMEYQYWQAGLWLVGTSTSGYYIDASVKGRGIRLRGAGGSLKGSISGSKFVIPEEAALTTDDISVGNTVQVTIKSPSKTYAATVTQSGYNRLMTFAANTAVVDGSKMRVNITYTTTMNATLRMTWGMSLREVAKIDGTVFSDIRYGGTYGHYTTTTQGNQDWTFSQTDILSMLGKVSSVSKYKPQSYSSFNKIATISSYSASLITPAFTKTITLPITAIETY